MQANSENLSKLSSLLNDLLSQDGMTRKQGEEQLKKIEGLEGYPILLMKLTTEQQVSDSIRLLASVTLKNFVKAQWNPVAKQSILKKTDKDQIKQNMVTLMLNATGNVRKLLSEVINTISLHDFYKDWPNLLGELVSKLQTSDLNTVHGVLYVAHSIFKRYRDKVENDEYVDEVSYILKGFAEPLLNLFTGLSKAILSTDKNSETIFQLFSCLELVVEIYLTLNSVTLPEFFENHMKEFMVYFDSLLKYNNTLMEDKDETEMPSLLTKVKTIILEILNIYMEKYGEEFGPFVDDFAKNIWGMLTQTGLELKYDSLVSKSMYFLTIISKSEKHVLFKSDETLKSICENIIIPNITLREADEDMFEDDPIEYIRRDIEGSDSDTRRRAATELVQGLSQYFDQIITPIFMTKVKSLLQIYGSNPQKNWKAKDAAIYLILAISVKGKTVKKGVTQMNTLVPIQNIFQEIISPEFQTKDVDDLPILKAGALKFLTMFRYQIVSKDNFKQFLPLLIRFLSSKSKVVHTYAAWSLERVLLIEDEKKPRFTESDVSPFGGNLLSSLFSVLKVPESQDNEYIMKAIMRVTVVLKSEMGSLMKEYVSFLTGILSRVCKNPKNPMFNRLLFESYATVIKFNPQSVEAFENALFPPFLQILQTEIEEFTPFVFQILSQLLEIRSTANDTYLQLLPNLLEAHIWENTGNIPGLVRLLTLYLKKSQELIIKQGYLEKFLAIFQKLVFSKIHDHEGFYILNAVIEYLSIDNIKTYLPNILKILFTRLSNKKTGKYVKCMVLFFSLFVVKFGGDALIQSLEGVQSGLFNMFCGLWIEHLPKISGTTPRKLSGLAVVKLLCETQQMNSQSNLELYYQFLNTLMKLLELPEEVTVDDDEDDFAQEYHVKFSKLSFASSSQDDITNSYPNVKVYLAQSLNGALSKDQYKQLFSPAISKLDNNVINVLAQYFINEKLNPNILK
eukprot:gene8130-12590_t